MQFINFLKNLKSSTFYVCSLPFLIAYMLFSSHEGKLFYSILSFSLFVLVISGLQIDLRSQYKKYGESAIFKALQYVFIFFCSYFAIFNVTNFISNISGFEGNYFQTTINFLSVIFTFFLWILSFSFLGLFYEFFAAIQKFFTAKNKAQKQELWLAVPKIFFYLILFAELGTYDFSRHSNLVLSIVREVEFRDRSLECQNYDAKNEKIRYVGDEKLLVVNRDGIPRIQARVCQAI